MKMHRANRIGVFKCVKFAYHQWRTPTSENTEELKITDIGVVQGDSK